MAPTTTQPWPWRRANRWTRPRRRRLRLTGHLDFSFATDLADAQFFALRQARGVAAVIGFELSAAAEQALLAGGGVRRSIPRGPSSPRFLGDELDLPPELFGTFDALRRAGEIVVVPIEE